MKKFTTVLALVFATLAGSAQAMGPKPPDPTLAAASAAVSSATSAATAASVATAASASSGALAKDSASSAKQSALAASAAAGSEAAAKAAAQRAEQAAKRAVAAQATAARQQTVAASAQGAVPSSFASMQPFAQFAHGEGEGYAREYKSRSKAQFVALLRDKGLAQKEMRVSCDVLVRQIMEGHSALPWEGCEGAARHVQDDNDYAVVACRDEMFRDNWLTVTNGKGSAFGVWHRKCLPGEQVLVYKGEPLISMTCLNPVIPMSRPAPPSATLVRAALPPVTGVCPNVYTLKMNVWTPSVLRLPGVAQTVAKEAMEVNGFSNREDFSRNRGGQVRKAEASGNSDGKRSESPRRFRISFINTDEAKGGSSAITAEEVLYDVTVTGLIEMRFTKAQLEKWDAIRTVSLDNDVQSPPTFGKTGLHELRFFNRLPRKSLGEWDNNPVPDCIMNQHAIESAQSVPPLVGSAEGPPKQ